ncbi:MAG: preprotein translocase subunit SecG [Azorhizobium sp. 12-66-6]|nr:MAG: preprotein translocase subunit SecG [Azorhizobium sp. 12-66-6]
MQTVLIVIHLMVVLSLIGVVLIQRSEGGGLGIGGNSGGSGGFVTSLGLTIMAGWGRSPPALLNQTGPAGPAVPQSGTSILDQIRPSAPATSAPTQGAPAAPAPAPTSPQVPQSQ